MENKTLTIIKLILLSLIALLLSVILVVLLVNPTKEIDMFNFSKNSKLVYEKEITDNISKIKVTTKGASIELEESSNDKLEIKYYGEEKDKDLSISTTNETLDINEETSYFCIGICNYKEHKIVISIPKNNDYEIDFKTTSGDVFIREISLTNVNVRTINGDINIINALNSNLESTSGDIQVNQAEIVNVKTVSGEITINQIDKECNLKTTSGDIEISTLNIIKNSKITTVSGDVEINRNNGSYIKTETLSGEVEIHNNDRYSKQELTIKTTSGDIEVGD